LEIYQSAVCEAIEIHWHIIVTIHVRTHKNSYKYPLRSDNNRETKLLPASKL